MGLCWYSSSAHQLPLTTMEISPVSCLRVHAGKRIKHKCRCHAAPYLIIKFSSLLIWPDCSWNGYLFLNSQSWPVKLPLQKQLIECYVDNPKYIITKSCVVQSNLISPRTTRTVILSPFQSKRCVEKCLFQQYHWIIRNKILERPFIHDVATNPPSKVLVWDAQGTAEESGNLFSPFYS